MIAKFTNNGVNEMVNIFSETITVFFREYYLVTYCINSWVLKLNSLYIRHLYGFLSMRGPWMV